MKSKAHMKKCLELGVSMTSVDDTETEEAGISYFSWLNSLLCMLELCGQGGKINLGI